MKLSHLIVRSLYDALSHYSAYRGAGQAALVNSYYEMWRSLHSFSVNISSEGWEALRRVSTNMGLSLRGRNDEWRFLFAIETYLHLLIRLIALSKLGVAPSNLDKMQQAINRLRGIFEHSVFEWVFIAASDTGLNPNVRESIKSSLNALVSIVYHIDFGGLTFDAFREVYQNILPSEVRRSLGEFYTREDVVDEVLDAAGLDGDALAALYERWRTGEKPIILDPACGSGSFLIRVARRILKVLGGKPDVASFIEDVLVGIDINPFAVEMSKLNLILVLAEELALSGRAQAYVPGRIRIYWGDSLAVLKSIKDPLNRLYVSISIPSLSGITPQGEFKIPDPAAFISAESLLEVSCECASKGYNADDFLKELEGRVGASLVRTYAETLRNLYDAISKIYRSGNSRLIELIKDSFIISDLIGRCDYVIGNPPWVRARELSGSVRSALRENFKFFSEKSPYNPSFAKTRVPFKEQHDYSIAFVERGLAFLRNGGILSYVITSKVLRSTYAGEMRRTLLVENTILRLIDYSLYPRPLFQDAINYPLIIAVRKLKPSEGHEVDVTVFNTLEEKRSFRVPQNMLPLSGVDLKSPWILAPQSTINSLRKVLKKGARLGDIYEVSMGVKTAKNELYFIANILGLNGGVVEAALIDGTSIRVEEDLIQALVRGRDIDPFTLSHEQFIIFPVDVKGGFKQLWDPGQKFILEELGLLSGEWEVKCSGATLIYERKTDNPQGLCSEVARRAMNISVAGGSANPKAPCSVNYCFTITYGGSSLDVSVEGGNGYCRVYVDGLRIPNAPHATRHFTAHLSSLLKRDDYKPYYPPWAIFRVSEEKFRDYRIAWQEMAKHIEACFLPVRTSVKYCGVERWKIVVPAQTVYFINEKDAGKALKTLVYLNSRLARNLMKLWAWSAREGTYRHDAYVMGHLPIPHALLEGTLWEKHLVSPRGDLNEAGREIAENTDVEEELMGALGLEWNEYKEIIEYGCWLNEKKHEKK